YANPGDFDGDGRADFVDHQGSNWWILNSRDLSVKMISFGPNLVFGAPGDFDGDGKTDIAVVSIEGHYKTWYYHSSLNPNQNPYLTRKDWGNIPLEGPIPRTVQGDYDGDGKTDYAVYVQTEDPNDHPKFWITPSNGGNPFVIPWGEYNWLPVYYNYPIASFNNR
ncbi:MAG TPA: VCBS repeat-containing protein, partial [Pyrinomonadaceae bacterium]|nr:VCBS repeat-containing protein [Pyrinomonadaceae bacterium]